MTAMNTYLHDFKKLLLFDAAVLAVTAAAGLLTGLVRGMRNIALLYCLRGVFLITGSIGLIIIALLIFADKAYRGNVKDPRFERHFYKLSFPTILSEISVVLLLAGIVVDYIVRL